MAGEKNEMRLDYALYAVATILFILSGVVCLCSVEPRGLWIITTTVLGFFFIGVGYTQRPKMPKATTTAKTPPPAATTPVAQEKTSTEAVLARTLELTEVKGIGVKRAERLKALGILNIEDLAKASAEDLASKLKISPKITKKWIEEAKNLLEKR